MSELQARRGQGYASPICFAIIAIGLRDFRDAFQLLEQAREAGDPWLTENGFDLIFDPIRLDPRWTQLRQRMGLET